MANCFLDDPLVNASIFFPRKTNISLEPTKAQQLSLRLSNNSHLACLLVPNPASKFLLILFHGNGELAHDHAFSDRTDFIWSCNLNILLFEYRGYGASENEPLLGKILEDIENLIPAISDMGYPPENVILLGRSLGSIFAIHYLSLCPNVAGIILDSAMGIPYDFYAKRSKFSFEKLVNAGKVTPEEVERVREAERNRVIKREFEERVDNLAKLTKAAYQGHVLILHAADDVILPLNENAKILLEAVEKGAGLAGKEKERKQRMVVFDVGGHNSIYSFNQEEYNKSLKIFFLNCKVLNKEPSHCFVL